jgi:hypothetical protein
MKTHLLKYGLTVLTASTALMCAVVPAHAADTKPNTREVPAWALLENLRMDPYERGNDEGGDATDFLARQMWLLVPVQAQIKDFFKDYEKFPHQEGSTLNPGGIGYGMLKQMEAMKQLQNMEQHLSSPTD